MLVVFANNQTMVAAPSSTAIIFTDPVAIGDNNRATGITNIHTIVNATGNGLTWTMQVSNDGVNWMAQGPTLLAATAEAVTLQTPTTISCVYARLSISFAAGASVIGAVVFDIHVNFDRS